jgi:hypothetical protein
LNRGFSQAFYREKLYETALGYKDLEDFLQNHWEKWACSKGNRSLPEIAKLTLMTFFRSREPASDDADLAEWRRLPARTVQWRLREGNGLNQGEDAGSASKDGSLLPVRNIDIVLDMVRQALI